MRCLVTVLLDPQLLELLLEDWLLAVDLGHLDAALSDKSIRTRFLEYLVHIPIQQPPFYHFRIDHPGCEGLLGWLSRRDMKRIIGQWRLSLASFEFLLCTPQTERLSARFSSLTIAHTSHRMAGLNVDALVTCVNVAELRLENIRVMHAPEPSPAVVASFLPSLIKCVIKSCVINMEFIRLLGSLPGLKEIASSTNAFLCPYLADSDRAWYLSYLSRLRRLSIYDEQLEHLLECFEQLDPDAIMAREVVVDRESMDPEALGALLALLPRLQKLAWTGTPPTRGSSSLLVPWQLETLDTLILKSVVLAPSLFELFAACPRMQTIEIEGIKLVDGSLRESNFAANLVYSKLRTLRLFHCQSDTLLWDHLRCSHFSSLLCLSLSTCSLMSFESYELFLHCHSLQTLELQSCMVYSLPTLLHVVVRGCELLQALVLRNVVETKSIEYHGDQRREDTWPALERVRHVEVVPGVARLTVEGQEMHFCSLFREGWAAFVTDLVLITADPLVACSMLLERLERGGFPRLSVLKLLISRWVPDRSCRGLFKRLLRHGSLRVVRVQVLVDEKGAQETLDGGQLFVKHAYELTRR